MPPISCTSGVGCDVQRGLTAPTGVFPPGSEGDQAREGLRAEAAVVAVRFESAAPLGAFAVVESEGVGGLCWTA